jgi:hypothetical protein
VTATVAVVDQADALDHAEDVDHADDVFVLHARGLRDGVRLEDTSRYRDDVWYLDAAIHQQHQRKVSMRLGDLPARYRTVAKQLCYALLSGPLPHGERRLQIGTVRGMFTEIKRFLDWMDRRPRPRRLAELAAADLEDYQRHLLAALPSGAVAIRSRARSGVRLFWRYRHALSADRIAFDPRHIDGWVETGPAATENATARIPEAVCGPLLAWALRFVDDFAPDILAVDRQWRHLHQPRVRRSVREREQALRALLDAHLADRRPLPGYSGEPSLAVIAAMINDYRRFILRYRPAIDAVAAAVGVRQYNTFDHPISGLLDGKPWIDAVATVHRGNNQGLACLARMLQAACYILIAYLSGMRDSEKRAELRLLQHSTARTTN